MLANPALTPSARVLAAMAALQPFQGPVSVDGGLSRNPYFVRFLSEIAGHDLFLPNETEQTAAGLARMAAEAAGVAVPEPRPGRLVLATDHRHADRLDRFRAAREAVEGFARLTAGLTD